MLSGPASKTLFTALAHRPFALLWAGQTMSRLGDNVYLVALAWLVLQETGSADRMSVVILCNVLPLVLLGLFGGVVVDRLPRLQVMFAADASRAAVNIVLAVGVANGGLEFWHLCVLSALSGAAQAFFQPAYVAVVPEITPVERLAAANSLSQLGGQVGQIAGPAIGALLVALGGAELGFAVNAFTFIMSAGTLLALARMRVSIPRGRGTSMLADFKEGLATVASEPWLWSTIAIASLANLALTGPMRVTVPFLIREVRADGALAYGLLLSAGAVGSVVVALTFSSLGRLRHRGVVAYLAILSNGVMLLVFALDPPIVAWWAAAFVGGAGLVLFELIWIGTLQDMVAGERLGRVAAIDYVGSFGLLPVGLLLAGFLTTNLGARETLVIGGLGMLALPLLALTNRSIRTMD